MNKYITMLALAAVASTAMAQQAFLPKHPGIIARQMQSQQEAGSVLRMEPQGKRAKKPAKAAAVMDLNTLVLDSVITIQYGAKIEGKYYEYHPDGKIAKQMSNRLDRDGNWVVTEHKEWSENYPMKGSSYTEFGYDTLGVYRGIYKVVYNDDNTASYTEYNGYNGDWEPTSRVSRVINEYGFPLTDAYYEYDENHNEYAADSIVYVYDDKYRCIRETHYYSFEKDGQLTEFSYYTTTYTEDVMTPSGLGLQATFAMSPAVYKQESIVSYDRKYDYYADFTKEVDATEWNIREEHTITDDLEISFKYKDNAVKSGHKLVYQKFEEDDSHRYMTGLEYSCGTDSTQWKLLRKLEDYWYTTPSKHGGEDTNHQSYITEADENGQLHKASDVMYYDSQEWVKPYVRMETEYYEGEELDIDYRYYYYHDPNSNAVISVKAQPKDGMQVDLSGRRVGNDYRGIVIKNGKKVLMK